MRPATTGIAVVIILVMVLMSCSLEQRSDRAQITVDPAGRVESVEIGIALTFPEDWQVEAWPASSTEPLTSIREPDLRELIIPVVAAVPPTRHDRCVLVDLGPLVEAQAGWTTLEEVVGGLRQLLEADGRWVAFGSTVVDLPAGPTGRIQRVRDGEAESVSSYVFTRAEAWFLLECVVHEVLTEDWRSIARTFEFLAPVPV